MNQADALFNSSDDDSDDDSDVEEVPTGKLTSAAATIGIVRQPPVAAPPAASHVPPVPAAVPAARPSHVVQHQHQQPQPQQRTPVAAVRQQNNTLQSSNAASRSTGTIPPTSSVVIGGGGSVPGSVPGTAAPAPMDRSNKLKSLYSSSAAMTPSVSSTVPSAGPSTAPTSVSASATSTQRQMVGNSSLPRTNHAHSPVAPSTRKPTTQQRQQIPQPSYAVSQQQQQPKIPQGLVTNTSSTNHHINNPSTPSVTSDPALEPTPLEDIKKRLQTGAGVGGGRAQRRVNVVGGAASLSSHPAGIPAASVNVSSNSNPRQPQQQVQQPPPAAHYRTPGGSTSNRPNQSNMFSSGNIQSSVADPTKNRTTVVGGGHHVSGASSRSPHGSSSQSTSRSRSTPSSRSTSAAEYDHKTRKQSFLNFTRVLMKYLESKDKAMHSKAKSIIRECAEKNKLGDPAYASLSASMQTKLREEVGKEYWKKAEDYLTQFLTKDFQNKEKLSYEDAYKKARQIARIGAEDLPGSNPARVAPDVRQQPMPVGGGVRQPKPIIQQQRQQPQQPIPQQRPVTPSKPKTPAETKQPPVEKPAKTTKRATKPKKTKPKVTKAKATKQPAATDTSSVVPGVPSGGPASGATAPVSPIPPKAKVQQTVPAPKPEELREYEEFMDLVDHSTIYDSKQSILILGNQNKKQEAALKISDEQRKLLYGSEVKLKPQTMATVPNIENQNTIATPTHTPSTGTSTLPEHLRGWGDRNILSSRSAWAKLRLPEQINKKEDELIQSQRGSFTAKSMTDQTLPSSPSDWINEETAEKDEALALISEGTQLYITKLLESAMRKALQRKNLDGVRLWHQQSETAVARAKATGSSSQKVTTTGKGTEEVSQPPLALRLGCDVKRQYALADGNAAKVCKRMEEALARKKRDSSNLGTSSDSFFDAISMEDLSRRPKLTSAASKADYEAKSKFQIFGGKDSNLPPLGRVPQKITIMTKDINLCLEDSSLVGAMPRKRRRVRLF